MKLPAIRGKIGIWRYYVTLLSFTNVASFVSRIDDELHKSTTLNEMIQRSITENYKQIKEYLINQEERFFNSLVLAIYDGNPEWVEVELSYEGGEEFFNLGFLELNGEEKMFPVDGQHRVEGIKAALLQNPDLADEQVPVIFIGHSKNEEGMKKTRRLFSTLNRYAKPVSMRDIIALDEDDIIAIITRDLLENHKLFCGEKVFDSKSKSISDANKKAITSVITLYDCNRELLKSYKNKNDINAAIKDYLKYRPSEDVINSYKEFVTLFWNKIADSLTPLVTYLNDTSEIPAEQFRNKVNGGYLLFRPIGLLPFITTVLEIKKRQPDLDDSDIITDLGNLELTLNQRPWKQVLWNDIEKKVIGGDNLLVKLLLLFMYNKDLLSSNELSSLKAKFGGKLGIDGEALTDVMDNL